MLKTSLTFKIHMRLRVLIDQVVFRNGKYYFSSVCARIVSIVENQQI